MRTTMTLDDALLTQLKEVAARHHISFKEAVDRALRAGIDAVRRRPPRKRTRLRSFGMGTPRLDLDKALALSASLDDEETARKLSPRK